MASTVSSTLDDLQLDITLQIHERICEFFSPWHYPLLLRNRCIRWKGRRRGGGSEAGEEVGRELPSPLFKEGAQQLRKGERLGQKTLCLPLFNANAKSMLTESRGDAMEPAGRALVDKTSPGQTGCCLGMSRH